MSINLVGLTESQIEEIEAQIKRMKEENIPKINLDYKNGYVVYGTRVTAANIFEKYLVEQLASIGLYGKTKEEADKLLNKLQTEEQLKRWSLTCGSAVDWTNLKQKKYFCFYNHELDEIQVGSQQISSLTDRGTIYFTSKAILDCAMEVIGKQMLKDYLTT